MLTFLEGQFSEDEAREVADIAKDAAADSGAALPVVWAVERAVLEAFGFEEEDAD